MKDALTTFTYGSLASDVQTRLRDTAEAIRSSARRQVEEVIATGIALLDAKQALEHGQFGSWLATEFNWSVRTVQRYISVAEAFGPNATCVSHLPTSVVYRLAALPPTLRERVIAAGTKGEAETIDLITQEAHEAKRTAVEATKSPERRKAEAEREKRRIGAQKSRLEKFAREQEAERQKERDAARKALDMARAAMPDVWHEFLGLAHAAHGQLWSAVRDELFFKAPSPPSGGDA